jgi:hypothetical protein
LAIRTDNGVPFAAPTGLYRLSTLAVSVSRRDDHGHVVRPNLFYGTESQSQSRLRRAERRRDPGRRPHLAGQLHAVRPGLFRR